MREIALDTETTGLDVGKGHRLVEIGCVELVDHVTTGRTWSTYLNPGRENEAEAYGIHGLSDSFLAGQPMFRDKAGEMMEFLGDSTIIIHNAEFDLVFLNNELRMEGLEPISGRRVIDSLNLARSIFPGQSNSLSALAKRFGIDASARQARHGALVDAELLAKVYRELHGRRPDCATTDPVRMP